MSSKTPNYNLHKIDLTDAPPDITVLNQNWDALDTELKNLNDSMEKIPSFTVDSALSDSSTNPVQNKVVKAALDNRLSTSGGKVTGTLVLSKVADADGDAYNEPALVVGGEPDTYHLELDNNEIQAKQNETTPGNLFLNSNGGKVTVGEGGLETDGDLMPTKSLTSNMGTAILPWNRINGRYFDIYGGADAMYGRLRVGTTGTEATDGVVTLTLGNETASGTAHNASGKITMYGKGTGFTNILPKETPTGSNTVYLPTGSGTLLLDTQGCKIQTGSYTGSNVYGSSNKNSLTFNFEPKLVIIYETVSADTGYAIFVKGSSKSYVYGYDKTNNVAWGANTLTWYGSSSSAAQLNATGDYYWVALG